MSAIQNPSGKQMRLKTDGTNVANIVPDGLYNYKKEEFLVNLKVGTVKLTMKMHGSSADDFGIIVTGVFLQKLVLVNSTNGTNHINTNNSTNTVNTTNSTNTTNTTSTANSTMLI